MLMSDVCFWHQIGLKCTNVFSSVLFHRNFHLDNNLNSFSVGFWFVETELHVIVPFDLKGREELLKPVTRSYSHTLKLASDDRAAMNDTRSGSLWHVKKLRSNQRLCNQQLGLSVILSCFLECNWCKKLRKSINGLIQIELLEKLSLDLDIIDSASVFCLCLRVVTSQMRSNNCVNCEEKSCPEILNQSVWRL